ncbi:class I SAM-dependent methyltransferase [Sphingomonas crusticola]|uniref:class I SAM-dependent methyltransferase n=1 Tax=Sphingomonas crusticola TaxID=1697973 RepID=UPI000E254F1C|nr:SAM-dependent methyltransferase [Sphingomonas crusticola]
MPASPDIGDELAALIKAEGRVSIERFMGAANAHYYATRDAIGAAGDFITAPEISQMFGEIIGLALADLWQRAGSPDDAALIELGPGRGTLASDMVRAMKVAGLTPPVHLVETSPLLRQKQLDRLPHASWHETIETLPVDRPLLIVANEFFDALPVRQLIKTEDGWRERSVRLGERGFEAVAGDAVPAEIAAHGADADPGTIVERNPAALALAGALAGRLGKQGGILLIIDYGYTGDGHGDTLQAVREHAFADPFVAPGASDLTAHVDFAALARATEAAGLRVWGPVEQGQWLLALGLTNRVAALTRAAPDQAEEIGAAYRRLTHPGAMGQLFKVMAATAPGWPEPGGF